MYLLDNNLFALIVLGNENAQQHVRQYAGTIFMSSIAAEEMLTGRLNGINRARSPRTSLSLSQAHEDFTKALEDLRIFPILPYSDAAEAIYKTFAPATLRIGPQDCRIAAQALALNMTVVTRNLRDFERIGVACQDWSA